MSEFVYAPPAGAPEILHADAALLLVNKPAGLLSVPGKGEDRADCLIARLRTRFPQVLLVHRLDLDTSGVMVFALTPKAQAHLGKQFERRLTDKRYIARIWGVPSQAAGQVDLPLIVDWPNRPKQMVDHENGRPAQTDWKLLEAEGETARVELKPLTGRSHQLRVHMLSLGHPILGDPLYATGPARAFPRLMLHAEHLALHHPDSGKRVEFSVPAPF